MKRALAERARQAEAYEKEQMLLLQQQQQKHKEQQGRSIYHHHPDSSNSTDNDTTTISMQIDTESNHNDSNTNTNNTNEDIIKVIAIPPPFNYKKRIIQLEDEEGGQKERELVSSKRVVQLNDGNDHDIVQQQGPNVVPSNTDIMNTNDDLSMNTNHQHQQLPQHPISTSNSTVIRSTQTPKRTTSTTLTASDTTSHRDISVSVVDDQQEQLHPRPTKVPKLDIPPPLPPPPVQQQQQHPFDITSIVYHNQDEVSQQQHTNTNHNHKNKDTNFYLKYQNKALITEYKMIQYYMKQLQQERTVRRYHCYHIYHILLQLLQDWNIIDDMITNNNQHQRNNDSSKNTSMSQAPNDTTSNIYTDFSRTNNNINTASSILNDTTTATIDGKRNNMLLLQPLPPSSTGDGSNIDTDNENNKNNSEQHETTIEWTQSIYYALQQLGRYQPKSCRMMNDKTTDISNTNTATNSGTMTSIHENRNGHNDMENNIQYDDMEHIIQNIQQRARILQQYLTTQSQFGESSQNDKSIACNDNTNNNNNNNTETLHYLETNESDVTAIPSNSNNNNNNDSVTMNHELRITNLNVIQQKYDEIQQQVHELLYSRKELIDSDKRLRKNIYRMSVGLLSPEQLVQSISSTSNTISNAINSNNNNNNQNNSITSTSNKTGFISSNIDNDTIIAEVQLEKQQLRMKQEQQTIVGSSTNTNNDTMTTINMNGMIVSRSSNSNSKEQIGDNNDATYEQSQDAMQLSGLSTLRNTDHRSQQQEQQQQQKMIDQYTTQISSLQESITKAEQTIQNLNEKMKEKENKITELLQRQISDDDYNKLVLYDTAKQQLVSIQHINQELETKVQYIERMWSISLGNEKAMMNAISELIQKFNKRWIEVTGIKNDDDNTTLTTNAVTANATVGKMDDTSSLTENDSVLESVSSNIVIPQSSSSPLDCISSSTIKISDNTVHESSVHLYQHQLQQKSQQFIEVQHKLQQAMENVRHVESIRENLKVAVQMNTTLQSKYEEIKSKYAALQATRGSSNNNANTGSSNNHISNKESSSKALNTTTEYEFDIPIKRDDKIKSHTSASKEKDRSLTPTNISISSTTDTPRTNATTGSTTTADSGSNVVSASSGTSGSNSNNNNSSSRTSSSDKLHREYRKVRKELSAMTTNYNTLMSNNARLLKQITEKDDMNVKSLSTILHLKNLTEKLVEERDTLETQMKQASQLALTARLTANAKERVTEEFMKEKKDANDRIVVLEEQLSKVKMELQHLSTEWASASSKISMKDDEITNLIQRCNTLVDDNDHKREEIRKLLDVVQTLEREIHDMKEKFDHVTQSSISSKNETIDNKNITKSSSVSTTFTMEQLQTQVSVLKNRLACPVCHYRDKECIIIKCRHMHCKSCVDERISNRSRKCPTCNIKFAENEVETIFLS